MSLVQAPLPVLISLQPDASPRKRTSSFSYSRTAPAFAPNPRPAKSQRITPALTPSASPTTPMGSALRRSETMIVIPEPVNPNSPSYRVLQHYKDQRLRRKGPNRATAHVEPITSRPRLELTLPQSRASPTTSSTTSSQSAAAAPKPIPIPTSKPRKTSSAFSFTPTPKPKAAPKPPSQIILPSRSSPATTLLTHRTSSPLSPMRVPLPGRPVFPRSRPEPDLYRTALKMRMRSTPEGQRMLLMGPRVAMSIMTATAELERIIAESEQQQQIKEESRDGEGDVMMGDATLAKSVAPSPTSLAMPVLTASWVVVKGEDWEMVDCAA